MRIHARFDEKYSRSLTADLNSEISGNLLAGLLKWLEPPKVGYFARNSELELDPVKLADLVESAFGAVAEIDAVDLREACEVRLPISILLNGHSQALVQLAAYYLLPGSPSHVLEKTLL